MKPNLITKLLDLWKSRLVRFAVYAFAAGVIFVLALDNVIMPWYVYASDLETPDVTGMKSADGVAVLEEAGFRVVIDDTVFTEKAEQDEIFKQRPEPGQVVKAGRRVYLLVSGGDPIVVVPSLRGKSIADARMTLERIGLTVGKAERVSSGSPRDVIVGQQYPAGTKIRKGKTVDVSMSIGYGGGAVEVPRLVGESLADAKRLLEAKNLRLGRVSYQPSSELLPNTVLDQYPSAGGRLDEQDQVDVVVSEIGEPGTDEAGTDEAAEEEDEAVPQEEEEEDESGAQ